MRNSERLYDFNAKIVRETDKAIQVTDDDLRFIWLPKSQCEIEMRKDGTADITLPEWLAKEKELL